MNGCLIFECQSYNGLKEKFGRNQFNTLFLIVAKLLFGDIYWLRFL